MDTKRAKKALLEVIPPRIGVTFRRASFPSRPESSKIRIWGARAENTVNTVSGSHVDFSEHHGNHENRSELNPYSTFRAENQTFSSSKVLPSQWNHWEPPKRPYKIKRIRQKSNCRYRGKCTLNYSVNRMITEAVIRKRGEGLYHLQNMQMGVRKEAY